MGGEHSGYFPLGWDSGIKQAMSKNSVEASPIRYKSQGAIESGPEALLGLIVLIRLKSGEGGSDSVDVFYVPKIRYWVYLRGQVWSYCHKIIVHGLSFVFVAGQDPESGPLDPEKSTRLDGHLAVKLDFVSCRAQLNFGPFLSCQLSGC